MEVVGWHRWLVGMWAAMEVLLLGGLVYGWPSLVFLLKQRRVYSDLCPPEHTPQLPHSNNTLPQSGGNATNAGAGPFGNGSSLPALESSSFPANYASLSGAWLALTTSLPLGYSYRSEYGSSESSVIDLTSAVVNLVENATRFAGGKGDNSSGFAEDWEGENCAEQDAAFALAYTVVTAVQSLGSIGVGHAQRTFGMRTTRIGSGYVIPLPPPPPPPTPHHPICFRILSFTIIIIF